ncbi:MAG: hypothetical protein WBA36_03610 [Mesorhizobium sp.]
MADTPWHPWTGGECPVDPEALVILRYRDGIVSKIRIAGYLRWQHADLVDDILAYRIVSDDEGARA